MPTVSCRVTIDEMTVARAVSRKLPFTAEAQETFWDIDRKLRAEGIMVTDRRMRWSVEGVRGFAYLKGCTEVEREHLEILTHILWRNPKDEPEKAKGIIMKLANPMAMEINSLLIEAQEADAAADLLKLATVDVAIKKLQSIARKLKGYDHKRAVEGREFIVRRIDMLRAAALEAKSEDDE